MGGPVIISTYEDVLTFDAYHFLENKEVTAAYLSRIDHKGHHTSYQITGCRNLPPFFEEHVQSAGLFQIFQETDITIIDQLPLRYITQTKKSPFTETIIKNDISLLLRVPLCKNNNSVFFLFILSDNDSLCNRDFMDLLVEERKKMSAKVRVFYASLMKIKNLFLSYRKILELKGDETFPHMERVAVYSHKIALKTWQLAHQLKRKDILKKFSPFVFETLKLAATIHDIGKLAIPETILNKPSKLTKEEFEIIKTHSEKGMEIIHTAFPNKESFERDLFSPELHAIIDITKEIIYQHHERLDGTGYPRGLKEHDIGLFSKIVSVADVFDAITSKRVYKAEQSSNIAIDEMIYQQSEKYDPLILEALLRTQNKSSLQSLQ